jgi:LAS superfamily LD-carboxypeptidase LdcB
MLTATIEELRGGDAVSRSQARPTPAPTPTIVGTFPPLADCAATVPTEEPPNGQLSDDELCSIGDGQELRADAAATYVAMNAAYAATFGSSICITDSYRSYASQQSLYWRKPNLAAVPGTSNHGWGIAVDLFCGADDPSSPEHAWLDEHSDEYGWFNPDWAQPGGSRPEPWHWEFDPSLLRAG